MIFRFSISIDFPGQATVHNFGWNPNMKNHQPNLHPVQNQNLFFHPMIVGIQNNFKILKIRDLCSQTNDSLTHVNEKGQAAMVNVSNKDVTTPSAMAQAVVEVGAHILDLIDQNSLKKGDVLTTAQVAGIMAAKRTSELIPLCHNIPLSHLKVDLKLDKHNHAVIIMATARCEGRTGVEMEALTAATVSSHIVCNMCRAVSHDIVISEVKLLFKTGGI